MRKPVFEVSDQVRHKPDWIVTEDGWRLKNFGFRKKRDCTIRVAKTKALISFAVTAKLICVFVFAYAKSRVSNNEAQIYYSFQYWLDFVSVKIALLILLTARQRQNIISKAIHVLFNCLNS